MTTSLRNHTYLIILSLTTFLFLGTMVWAAETGQIQVNCEPGVQIFLDGTLKGTSNTEQKGLLVKDVPVGKYNIKLVKNGYAPQKGTADVKAGEITLYAASTWARSLQVEQEDNPGNENAKQTSMGTLIIQSQPNACEIQIPDLKQKIQKTKDTVSLKHVQPGKYDASFTARNSKGKLKKLTYTITIPKDAGIRLMVNFDEENIQDTYRQILEKDLMKELEGITTKTIDLGDDITMEMVYIAGGTFQMGSPPSGSEQDDDAERPVHTVKVDGFWMGKYEVTQEQYEKIMEANPSHFKSSKNPVDSVIWDDAISFCDKLSQLGDLTFRLPTEAEWEYACRAGSQTAYHFGDLETDLVYYAWYSRNSGGKPHPVGMKLPNAWGLHDMHGNAWEWCNDFFDEEYYANSPQENPTGPSSGASRAFRGGCYINYPFSIRSAVRRGSAPNYTFSSLGFRVVATENK